MKNGVGKLGPHAVWLASRKQRCLCRQVYGRRRFFVPFNEVRVCHGLFCQLSGEMVLLGTVVDCMLLWHVVFRTLPPSRLAFGVFFFSASFLVLLFIYSFFLVCVGLCVCACQFCVM